MLQEHSCCSRKVFAGAGLVAVIAGRWSLVQEGSPWCRKVVAGAGR